MSFYRAYFVPNGTDPSGLQRGWGGIDGRGGGDRSGHGSVGDSTQKDLATAIWSGPSWSTVTSLLAITNRHRAIMKREGNDFGYNLHTAWLTGRENGSVYTPTAGDVAQVKQDTTPRLKRIVGWELDRRMPIYCCPETFDFDLSGHTYFEPLSSLLSLVVGRSASDPSAPSSGMYDETDNWNMFLAYGGVNYSLKGTAKLVQKSDATYYGWIRTSPRSCYYHVDVDATWSDTYTFKNVDILKMQNPYFDAGLNLENRGIGIPITHSTSYSSSFGWTKER